VLAALLAGIMKLRHQAGVNQKRLEPSFWRKPPVPGETGLFGGAR
jgi:hypothetical protein